jgi:hypothetical protein
VSLQVRCVRIINPVTGLEVPGHPSVHVGSTYVVLEVLASYQTGQGRVQFRIATDDDGVPSLWPGEMFESVDSAIPPNWGVKATPEYVVLAPHTWLRPGFWEDFFDRVPEALEAYERERRPAQ